MAYFRPASQGGGQGFVLPGGVFHKGGVCAVHPFHQTLQAVQPAVVQVVGLLRDGLGVKFDPQLVKIVLISAPLLSGLVKFVQNFIRPLRAKHGEHIQARGNRPVVGFRELLQNFGIRDIALSHKAHLEFGFRLRHLQYNVGRPHLIHFPVEIIQLIRYFVEIGGVGIYFFYSQGNLIGGDVVGLAHEKAGGAVDIFPERDAVLGRRAAQGNSGHNGSHGRFLIPRV